VPSAVSSAFYLLIEAFPQIVPMPQNLAELRTDRERSHAEKPVVPNGFSLQPLDADGVRAERICGPDATTERQILFLPGGGFTSIAGNGQRGFAAAISQRTKACVLLAHYRLAPEHPFPAGRDDGVTAYRWLLRQTPAKNLAIMGDSAGGNLTLATALKLRDDRDALPASLVATSAPADLALTGGTFRTLKDRDPLLTEPHRKLVYDSYTKNGTLDTRDPLMSPLHAALAGLPPTLLMVGTQEVLIGDLLALGEKLRKAGVQVDVQAWPGQVHAWNLVLEEAPESTMTNDQIAAHLLRAWGSVR
jgi:acetyl esterase/lipase